MSFALLTFELAIRQSHFDSSLPWKHTRLSLGPEPVRISFLLRYETIAKG